ncbi:MAG TPA: GNAT family N-acetyltransferase [Thermoleophilia bacterium]|nr:GNAT family N-acetyltransferase [Thermoleophilia bacterium]
MTAADLAAVAEVLALSFPDKLAGMLPGRTAAGARLLAHAALESGDAWVIGDEAVDGAVDGLVTFQDRKRPWYRHAEWRLVRRQVPLVAAFRAALFLLMFHAVDFSADELYLETMAVHPRARCRGVGGELLRFADDEAGRRGRRTLSLYCISANTHAHALYERCGYRDVRREDLWWCAWALGFRFTDRMRKRLPAG